ncbi:insulinase family protein [Vibrio sp. V27_P1S3P104]|nr:MULTISPECIES: M16 family metallopeptidase [Vibrio]NAX35054.1 insulinase family protein [Vibrio sp. V29_P1S30P107]NAW68057.1 insulinase family protein [Vibrio sp. V28_P6S34P95]NAX04138.1 insulinase family protein [Vibrio sp. V30_P3S12P165]NAX37174.1 insulinase family protein [Vibrio sp. V27_P1S3P104]NNN43498.1 insulinase family protein [Vibrio sp. 1-1(7)]
MNYRKIVILSSVIWLAACQLIHTSTTAPLESLRFNPNITVGTLANGFRYYIAKNSQPESRVYIRFVVNAGSMNEDDDQRGVAHIVEHMAFNGTAHYPGNQVIAELEKAGMKFGVDINAFTDFENTVYKLNLPKNDVESLTLAMNVVADWASRVTMFKDDLDAERGIVLEEWRARLGPMLRLGDKKSAIEMAGSRYTQRDPIGDVKTIKTVSNQRVADFYHRWYRPDNMSVVVVGDIDPTQVEQLIHEQFSSLSKPNTPLETIDYSIPLVDGWRSAVVSEEGITTPSVELSFFSDYLPQHTLARYEQDLATQIATRLLNIRLQDWEQQETHAVSSASFYASNIGRETHQAVFSLQLVQDHYQQATEGLMAFLAQVQQHGFTLDEFDGEIARLNRINAAAQQKVMYSIDLVGDLMVSAASGQLLLSEEDKYRLNHRFLSSMTLDKVNQAFQALIKPESRLVLITQPVNRSKPVLTTGSWHELWETYMATPQGEWRREQHQASLPVVSPHPGSVKREKRWAEHQLTEYRLSNGSKLIYRYSDSNPGQVHFKALTSGGLRSVPREDYHVLRTAVSLVDETGIGEVSLPELQSIFRGNPVVMSTILDDYQQGFSGWAKTDNVDKMFQLLHIKLASSPVSEKVLKEYQTDMLQRSQHSDGMDRFIRRVSALRYPNIPTVYSERSEQVARFTSQRLSDIYQQYFANKTDYTYFVVGDIQPDQLERLAAHYLASLPYHAQQRSAYSVYAQSPKEGLRVFDSKEPRAEVELYLAQAASWRPDHAYYLELAGELVQEQLRLTLREEASGVYGVTSWFWQDPDSPQAEGRILFSCDPERVDELLSLTHDVLRQVAEQGSDADVLKNKQIQREDQIARYLRSDLGILSELEKSYRLTDSPALIQAQRRANQHVSKEKVDAIMQPFLAHAERFEAILLPVHE